jgi:hypothetical protein
MSKEDLVFFIRVSIVFSTVFLTITGCTPPAERTKPMESFMPDKGVTVGDVPMILVEIDGRVHPMDRM